MFKFLSLFAVLAAASAAPGLIAETHSIVQPAILAKTAVVDTSASSAITHQSFTNLVRKVPAAPVVHTYAVAASPVVHSYAAPTVVKTVASPVLHNYSAAPVVKTIAAPTYQTYSTAPIVKTLSSPLVHTYAADAAAVHAPVVQTYATAPVIHSASLAKTIVSSPVSYNSLYH